MTDDKVEERVKRSEERENTSDSSLRTPHSSNGDYPLYANRRDSLTAASGRPLRDLSLQATLTEEITSEDYSISAETLRAQAEIARDAGYPQLAQNLERAAELTAVPNETLLEMYEMLRPGRCKFEEYQALARRLREEFNAATTAAFVEEAAAVYQARGLLRRELNE